MTENGRYRGALLGLAAGDAVGTTVEFRSRGSFEPLTDMVGGGPFRLEPGQWTDDTSMALCLATSLVEKGFDPGDQMNRYLDWRDHGYLSSNGRCFDIGNTVSMALHRYEAEREPFSGSVAATSAGNGSLMRLAPVPLFYHPDIEMAQHFAAESSRTTHGAPECLDACRLFALQICRALSGDDKERVLVGDTPAFASAAVDAIAKGAYRVKSRDEVRGTGYVIDCLEAALWCFDATDSFRDAVLLAANLGDDADTTAAVCGQIAGAYYGASGIPDAWRAQLTLREEIEALADRLQAGAPAA